MKIQTICCLALGLMTTAMALSAGDAQPATRPASNPAVLPLDSSAKPMRSLIEQYTADSQLLGRDAGLPWSEMSRKRLAEFLAQQTARLGSVDFDQLDQASRIDYLLLRNRLTLRTRELNREAGRLAEISEFVPFAPRITQLMESWRTVEPMNAEKAASELEAIRREASAARHQFAGAASENAHEAGKKPDKVTLYRAAEAVDELREALKEWNRFYAGYHPEFDWWAKDPFIKADKTLADYADDLRKLIAGGAGRESDPLVGKPIGREALLDALESELIPYSPEELIEIAEKEFAWCDHEMRRVSAQLGYGQDGWAKALDHVSQIHEKPGEQPQLIKRLAEEAIQFLEDRDLVTIPPLCKSGWRMEMMSVERQKVNPFFTGGETISVSFPTDGMSHEDKLMSLRGNNAAFCKATVQHELIPGHHLQLFMADRFNAHRKAFRTPFLIEGWALYWEMRLWDLGFAQTPQERVGMLFWRSHRCARIIFSLKFHLGQMSADEAVDFLVKRVGHERRNATAEVRRSIIGTYEPLYQAAYMLGGLQLRGLHDELVGVGKTMTERQFHDAVLKENAIPIELLRASLKNQPLTRDFRSSWRFCETKK